LRLRRSEAQPQVLIFSWTEKPEAFRTEGGAAATDPTMTCPKLILKNSTAPGTR